MERASKSVTNTEISFFKKNESRQKKYLVFMDFPVNILYIVCQYILQWSILIIT
jgi:hypothetical protein